MPRSAAGVRSSGGVGDARVHLDSARALGGGESSVSRPSIDYLDTFDLEPETWER